MKSSLLLFVSSSIALAACGSSFSTPSASTPLTACEAYVAAQVAHADRCRDSAIRRSANTSYDAPVVVQACTSLLGAPGISVSAEQLSACASALKDAGCEKSESTLDACLVLETANGTLAAGASCLSSAQCASSYCKGGDIDSDGVQCGKCAERLPVGASCEDGPCVKGSACLLTTESGTERSCVANVAEGGACDASKPGLGYCGSGLYCTDDHTCAKRLGLGAACKESFDGPCAGSLSCIAGTCQVRLAEGTACNSEGGYEECDFRLTCKDGKCVMPNRAKVGESCAETSCVDEASCKAKVCVARKALGASCDPKVDACSRNAVCVDGTCKAPDYGSCREPSQAQP